MTPVIHVPERTEPASRFVIDSRTFARHGARTASYIAFNAFRARVERPHPLSWLGSQVGLEPDDPRLAEIALTLANAGHLCVYVRRSGEVGEVGRPKVGRSR
jgi:hypothetical protein